MGEIKAVEAKLEVTKRFKDTVKVIEDFCGNLTNFDNVLKSIDEWMQKGTAELKDVKDQSGNMLPEDRVARTMDLQEDIASKLQIIKTNTEAEKFKDELARITVYVQNLSANTIVECDKYSNDVKYWAEYRTGIKEFTPWLVSAEKAASEGLSKPSDLSDVKALN